MLKKLLGIGVVCVLAVASLTGCGEESYDFEAGVGSGYSDGAGYDSSSTYADMLAGNAYLAATATSFSGRSYSYP